MKNSGRRLFVFYAAALVGFSRMARCDLYIYDRSNKCGRYECQDTPESTKFRFSQDKWYKYSYTLNIVSTFDNESKNQSSLNIEFRVDIGFRSCEGDLRVTGQKEFYLEDAWEKDGIEKLYEEVKKYSLRFSFYDGSINNVCPHESDSVLAINIKKGILSAFQNKMNRFDVDKFIAEKDVTGICPTHYYIEKIDANKLILKKTKEISACSHRYKLHSIIPTSPYIFQTKYHKWAPVISTSSCNQTIDVGVPTDINCVEKHVLKLFSNDTHGSSTTVMQHLQYLTDEDMDWTSDFLKQSISIREDLLFNHTKPVNEEMTETIESEKLIEELCEMFRRDADADAASTLSKFIHTARHLSYRRLRDLIEMSDYLCPSVRKRIQDTLPFLRSPAAIYLMKEIINDGEESDSTINSWFFSISLFPSPDKKLIDALSSFLFGKRSDYAMFSVTSLIHSYCSLGNNECSGNDISAIITRLELTFNETLYQNNDVKKSIRILKGLGNAGVHTDTIEHTLKACILHFNSTMDLKIAAIETHRRLPCGSNLDFLTNLYTNFQSDAELRIATYLQIMKCPSYSTIRLIKLTLDSEITNQVGSFVFSHLKNTAKSSLSEHVEVQSILQDYELQSKFDKDFRQFSKNYESSFYTNDYGTGIFIVTNVIFSSNAYIPRYITVNITVSAFGESVNVFQFDAYLEGFERYVERYFKHGASIIADVMNEQPLPFGFVQNISNAIKEQIVRLPRDITGVIPEPKVSFDFKLFGNVFGYKSYAGHEEISDALSHFNVYKLIKDFMSGQEIALNHASVFMDMSYVTPTSAGVPLNLDAVGISITNFDISILVNTMKQLFIKGKIKPKFSINFEGTMCADLAYEQTLIQIKSKMFTSSALEGKLEMPSHDDMTLSLNLPLNKFNLFSIQTDLTYKDNTDKTYVSTEDSLAPLSDKNAVCFWPIWEQAFGLKICSTYYGPDVGEFAASAPSIFRNPFKFSLFAEKSDATAKIYIMTFDRKHFPENVSLSHFKFETPDSAIKRKLTASVYLSDRISNCTITINLDKNVLETRGSYKRTPLEKKLNFDLDINDRKHLNLTMELRERQEKRSHTYWPYLYLEISSKRVAELSGSYSCVDKRGISQCDVDLTFKTNKFDSEIFGYIRRDASSTSAKIRIAYKFEKTPAENLSIAVHYGDKSYKSVAGWQANLDVDSTSYPQINSAFAMKYLKTVDHVDMKLNATFTPDRSDDKKQLSVNLAFMYYKSINGFKLNSYFEIVKRISDINAKLQLTHHHNNEMSTSFVLARYAKDKNITMKLDLNHPAEDYLHQEIKLNVTLPAVENPMIVYIKVYEKYENEYELNFDGRWFSGHTAMARGFFQDKSSHYRSSYHLKLEVKSRLFNAVLIMVKMKGDPTKYEIDVNMIHNDIEYNVESVYKLHDFNKRVLSALYKYNHTSAYSIRSEIDIPYKTIVSDIHLDRYRDIRFALRGSLRRWNTNAGFEFKWDMNRDPSQKFIVNLQTNSEKIDKGVRYDGKFIFEYPEYVGVASFIHENRVHYKTLSVVLKMSQTTYMEVLAFSHNEYSAKGVVNVGFKLLTPFENWNETALFWGFKSENRHFQTNGTLIWQENNNIVFKAHGGYSLDNVTSLTLGSSLNSTLRDLSSLAFALNYTRIADEIQISFLFQPNKKYSISVSTMGAMRRFENHTEYFFSLYTRTPFLENSIFDFDSKLKITDENSGNIYANVQMDDKIFSLFLKGVFKEFENSSVCLRLITPYGGYERIRGKLEYELESKSIRLNLMNDKKPMLVTDIVYLYKSLYDFNIKLHVVSQSDSLSNLLVVAMFTGKRVHAQCSWNTISVGFAGTAVFKSWSNVDYQVRLWTPIKSFKECWAVCKILYEDEISVAAHVAFANNSKAGIKLEYDAGTSKVRYQDLCELPDDDFKMLQKEVLKYIVFELDTLVYPTISVAYSLVQIGNTFDMQMLASALYLKASANSQLIMKGSDINWDVNFQSSIDLFSSALLYFDKKGSAESTFNCTLDAIVVSFGTDYRGGFNAYYDKNAGLIDESYERFDGKSVEKHYLELKIITPLEWLETGDVFANVCITEYTYGVTVDLYTILTNFTLTANVTAEKDFFNMTGLTNLTSANPNIIVPPFKLMIFRNGRELDNQMAFSLAAFMDESDYQDLFLLKSSWYIDGLNFITLGGELITPFQVLDKLKGFLQYEHRLNSETYNLEIFMKHSNKTEMKARVHLKPPSVTINIESTMENMRNAHFNGSLKKSRAGQQRFDAVMITDNSYRIQGFTSSTNSTPFAIEGKLLRGKNAEEISSLSIYMKKLAHSYDIAAKLHSGWKILEVQTEISDGQNKTKYVTLKIKTMKDNSESLMVNGKLLMRHPGQYLLRVQGESVLKNIKGTLNSLVEVWSQDDIFGLSLVLDSTTFTGISDIFFIWKPPNTIFGKVNASYTLNKKLTDTFNSKLYFMKTPYLFENATTGLAVNVNEKWVMEANATTVLTSKSEIDVSSNILLPNREKYSVTGKLKYNEEFYKFQHLLVYTKSQDAPCYTISDIKRKTDGVDGMLAFKCGVKDSVYLVDSFQGEKIGSKIVFINSLKSNTLKNNLITDIRYDRPAFKHVLDLACFYPPKRKVANINVDYRSSDNFDIFMNSTSPFMGVPYFKCEIKAETNELLYHRVVKLHLQERAAFFDVYHAKTKMTGYVTNYGKISLVFPITTWHEGVLTYAYDDDVDDIVGNANLVYNKNRILEANFTHKWAKMEQQRIREEFTSVDLNNEYVPVGVNYRHRFEHGQNSSSLDFKRVEIFKLLNASTFNLTGELYGQTEGSQDWTTFKFINSNRSLLLKSHTDGENFTETGVSVVLKPEIWMNYAVRVSHFITNLNRVKSAELKISYPRRNFSLVSDFNYGDNYTLSQFTVLNYLTDPIYASGLIFKAHKSPEDNRRRGSVIIFHPSFTKNVTLTASVYSSKPILAEIKGALEYSRDEDRKLTFSATIADKSNDSGKHYVLLVSGRHPETRFKFDVSGVLTRVPDIHFVANNISYERSGFPDQYWIGKALLNTKDNVVEILRDSLRGKLYAYGDYKVEGWKQIANGVYVGGISTNISGRYTFDPIAKYLYVIVNVSDTNRLDVADKFEVEGNMPENKAVKFNVWKSHSELIFPHFSFHLTLNHSRFLSSILQWRSDIGTNFLRTLQYFITQLWESAQESADFVTHFVKSETTETIVGIWKDAKPALQDFINDLHNAKTIQENVNYFKNVLNNSYHRNEFYMRDIHELYVMVADEISIVDKLGSVPIIVNEIWQSMGETGQVIRKAIIWVVDTAKKFYEDVMLVIDKLVEGEAEVYIQKFISKGVEKFDKFMKDLHISLILSTERMTNELVSVLSHYWRTILEIIEPTFVLVIHHLDVMVAHSANKLLEFMYTKRQELMTSPYFLRSANFTHKLDSIYKDFANNDIFTNLRKYLRIVGDAVYNYYLSHIPFRQELSSIGGEITDEIHQLYKLPFISYTLDNLKGMYAQVEWMYNYFRVGNLLQNYIPYMYKILYENSYTALDNEMRNIKGKTKFVFDFENGSVILEQKLPFPWHAFNETPIYDELSEYKLLRKYQNLFSTISSQFWSIYNSVVALCKPDTWFPPYESFALIVGARNYITFDGRHVSFNAGCTYLLSSDFANHDFALVLNYDEKSADGESLTLFAKGEVIRIDMRGKFVKIESRPDVVSFPIEFNGTSIYFDNDIITVKCEEEITIRCNTHYNLCSVHLSGWLYGKVSGLLGTMNNEAWDDLNHYQHWLLYEEKAEMCKKINDSNIGAFRLADKCLQYFTNESSEYDLCFDAVDPTPYYSICAASNKRELCTILMAYVQACSFKGIALKIPNDCVLCTTSEGEQITEGQKITENQSMYTTMSGDIVFIVEAKKCNEEMKGKKRVRAIISAISKELHSHGFVNNRYAVVVFGGDGVYEKPHSVIMGNSVFTNSSHVLHYFDRIRPGNGNSDIFSALRFAMKLSFRAGVSKSLILIPCSNCDPNNMAFDYTVLYHAMSEKSVRLHVLVDGDFPSDKMVLKDYAKGFIGFDKYASYTKNEVKNFKENALNKVMFKKSFLGHCVFLALESNGTIFTTAKLSNQSNVQSFSSTFARMVRQRAYLNANEICECYSDKNGVPFVNCVNANANASTSYGHNEFELEEENGGNNEDEDVKLYFDQF